MKITCITQLSLEKWNSMTAQEIRSALPTRPGPLKRFRAAINRITRFQDALERFKANQTLENNCRTHILAPNWAQTERCASCNAPINFSCEPRKLTRKCTKPKDFPVQILDSWSQSYEVMLRLLQSICSKLQIHSLFTVVYTYSLRMHTSSFVSLFVDRLSPAFTPKPDSNY